MSEEAKAGEANASKSEHKHEHKSFGWKSSPSKIERLCMHSEPKSGPPPLESKRNMDTKVPIRRPNDDFIKSSLSDVCEENEIDFAKERFSRSSLSPESIYGKPPKPFDKADLYLEATGRRRSSDQGIVLTTNTDSFIIGQKVWVGGIRPGQIAYIGETHFAPGEWAGIVLDEPNGKNDGCVAGKRYFQCEPKKGIFSRLTRLTHEPIGRTSISKDGNVEYDRRTITPDRSRTASPTSSLRSINMKNGGKNGMCIGDRVIVSSGLGSRPGILQYMGETKFAAGNWCGIQLDDPTGKNNGSVDGIRYFDCPPKYGIFVPIAKVSLSPGSKKSRLSRAGSKESLTSVGTGYSVASTNTSRLRMGSSQKLTPTPKPISTSKNNFSLQDVIREKQNHIEQLMIERDLDREDAHNQVMILQRNINELNDRVHELEKILDDEKKKTEDLQFTIDEATFCGDEFNIQAQQFKEKIADLERKLQEKSQEKSQEESSAAGLSSDLNNIKLENVGLTNEIKMLQSKLEEAIKTYEEKILDLTQLEEKSKDEIKYLMTRNEELQKELVMKDENTEKLFLNIKELENSLTDETTSLRHLLKEQELKNSEMEKLYCGNELSSNEKHLEHIKHLEKEWNKRYSKLEEEHNKQIQLSNEYNEEINNLKIQIENDKKNFIEIQEKLEKNNSEQFKKEIDEIQLENQIDLMKKENLILINNLKDFENNKKNLLDEIKNLKEQLNNDSNQKIDLDKEIMKKNQEISENEILINQLNTKMNLLNEKLNELQNKNKNLVEEIQVKHENIQKLEQNLKDINQNITDQNQVIENKNNEFEKIRLDFSNLQKNYDDLKLLLENDSSKNCSEIDNLKIELFNVNSLKNTLESKIDELNKTIKDLENLIKDKDSELSKLQNEILIKENLIEKHQFEFENNIKPEFDRLKTELQVLCKKYEELSKNYEISEEKSTKYESEIMDLNQKCDNLNQKCNEITNQKDILEKELQILKGTSTNINSEVMKLSESLLIKQKEYDELLSCSNHQKHDQEIKLKESENKLNSLLKQLENLQNDYLQKENERINLIQEIEKQKELSKLDLTNQLSALKNEHDNEKQLVINQLNEKLEKSITNESKLKESISNLELEINKFRTEMENIQKDSQLKQNEIKEYCNKNEQILVELEKLKSSEINLNKLLEEESNKYQTNMNNLNEQILLKNQEIEKLNSLLIEKNNCERRLSVTEGCIKQLQIEKESLQINMESEYTKNTEITKKCEILENLIKEIEMKNTNLIANETELKEKLSKIDIENNDIKQLLNTEKEIHDKTKIKLEETLTSKDNELSAIREQINEKDKLTNLQSNINQFVNIGNTPDDIQLKLNEFNQQTSFIKELNEKVTEMQSIIIENEETINKLQSNQNDIEIKYKKLISEHDLNKSNLKELQHKIEEKSLIITDLQNQINLKEKQISENKTKIDSEKMVEKKEINIEEDDNAECEKKINFLNTIIVDMQKKNETLTARINTLESTPLDFTQSMAFTNTKRQPAPRLYCDICDEFDGHDTENCPIQSSDSPTPPPSENKKLSTPRQYCELCEVFGHAAGECTEYEDSY